MNAHVFTTSTSASSASAVICIPLCKTLPSMISASTRFFAQPRLIMPTFGGDAVSVIIGLSRADCRRRTQTRSWRRTRRTRRSFRRRSHSWNFRGILGIHRFGAADFRFRRFLQIRISIGGQTLRRLEGLEIRGDIDVEKLAVDQEEPFRVGETRELRKIFVLDFLELGRPDLRHPPGFLEGETAREAGFL